MSAEQLTWRHLPKSEETKRKISEAKKGVRMPEYLVEAQTSTWNIILPFLKRNASAFEIGEITGLTKNQITQSVHNRNRRLNRYDAYFDVDRVRERRTREYARRVEKNTHRFPSEDQKNSIAFAKKLFERGLMPEQLDFWQLTRQLAEKAGKSWFDNFSYGLVMEFFMYSKAQELKGKGKPINLFQEAGVEVDPKWFNNGEFAKDRKLAASAITQLVLNSQRRNR